MGYTLELYAVRLDAIANELRMPRLDPAALAARPGAEADAGILRNWTSLASSVAQTIAAGGGEIGGPLSGYVSLVVRAFGNWYGSVWHTSSGGDDFRAALLGRNVAQLYGPAIAQNVVNREFLGLAYTDRPMFGWATNAELRATGRPAELGDLDPDAEDDIVTVTDAIARAAATGQELMTMYV